MTLKAVLSLFDQWTFLLLWKQRFRKVLTDTFWSRYFMFKKIYLFFFAFMLYYHTLIKPAVVCFCVAVHPSVNMHLLETKELYFMKTGLSDLYAENFSEEVHFYLRKYHSCCLLGFFLPLQSSPHSLAEVRFPQCLAVQLQTLQHSNVPQKNDQKNPKICTASSALSSQDLALKTCLSPKCELWFLGWQY